jgi:hypothetical protein
MIMEDMVVLFMTSRPEWMTFDEYKKLQKLQRKLSKIVKRGRLEWVSKVHPSSSIVSEILHDNKLSRAETENLINLITKGRTYRKRVVKEDDQ